MKNILIICSTLNAGGAAKIVSNLTRHLPEEWGIDILLNSDENIEFSYRGKIISLDIPEPKSRISFLYQGEVFLKRWTVILKLKRQKHYKACISFMDSANIVNILTGSRYCNVIINIVNNMSAQGKNIPVYRWVVCPLIRMFYNRADKIVAVSEEVKKDIVSNFGVNPQKVTSILCSIDIEDIDNQIKCDVTEFEKIWFSKEKTVITAGRMEKQKGQWHLIRAFSRVLEQIPDAKLVIFGNGSLEGYLKKLVRDYHMESSVLFYGFNKNLDKYISRSAVFVFPSLYEGLSMTILEALACSVPCIATDCSSGTKEQLAPGYMGGIVGYYKAEYGIIVEKSSEEMPDASVALDCSEQGMADAIVELLKSEDIRRYYANKARERSKVYDAERIGEQWLEIIEK